MALTILLLLILLPLLPPDYFFLLAMPAPVAADGPEAPKHCQVPRLLHLAEQAVHCDGALR